jgi:hypothetical protein
VDTRTLGRRDFTVTATDRVGARTAVRRRFTVVANRPDNHIRAGATGPVVGQDVYTGGAGRQAVSARVGRRGPATFFVWVQNDGAATDRFRVRGTGSDRRWRVRYFAGSREITGAVVTGRHRVGPLDPGRSRVIRVRVHPTGAGGPGARKHVAVTSSSPGQGTGADTVRAVLRRA